MSKNNRKSSTTTTSSRRTYSTRGLSEAIRTFLSKNPGARYGQIASAMRKRFRFVGTAENRISATLNQLFKYESLRRTGKPGFFEYYVRSSRR
jgi:hypothetical protein